MNLTRHGEKRLRRRLGLSKKSAQLETALAFQFGISFRDTKGRLRSYLNTIAYQNLQSDVRVYNGHIYIFRDQALITTWPLPGRFNAKQKRAPASVGEASEVWTVH